MNKQCAEFSDEYKAFLEGLTPEARVVAQMFPPGTVFIDPAEPETSEFYKMYVVGISECGKAVFASNIDPAVDYDAAMKNTAHARVEDIMKLMRVN